MIFIRYYGLLGGGTGTGCSPGALGEGGGVTCLESSGIGLKPDGGRRSGLLSLMEPGAGGRPPTSPGGGVPGLLSLMEPGAGGRPDKRL